MRLKFFKVDGDNCVSILTGDNEEIEFSYVEMIKQIYLERNIDTADISEDYTEGESNSINTLNSDISTSLQGVFSEGEDNEITENIAPENIDKIF